MNFPFVRSASIATLMIASFSAHSMAAISTTKSYAQGEVDRLAYLRPDLLRIDLIASPPGSSKQNVIASTVAGAVGQAAPTTHVSNSTVPVCHPKTGTNSAECVLQLHDTPGGVVGSMVLEFPYFRGQSLDALAQSAMSIRDEMAETIPTVETLFEDRYIAPKPGDTQAQCMVLAALAHHPDLMVLAMHVTPAGSTENRVLAINVPKILGEVSEPIEHDLAKKDDMLFGTIGKTHRLEIHVPLLDAQARQIGNLATVYFWHRPEDTPDTLRKTLEIRRELQVQIRDLAALYEPCETAHPAK